MPIPKVLIVEDDRVIVKIAEWRLNKLGYEVAGKAETEADAMELVIKNRPDVILMDINLKGEIDGIETAKRIKKDFNIPVIFVTSHTDGDTLIRAKAIRPDGFIRKPFEDDDLRVAIELALGK
jgi:CheY-like chemotaxis protein